MDLTVIMYVAVARYLDLEPVYNHRCGFWAAALFAAHPICTECVANIVGEPFSFGFQIYEGKKTQNVQILSFFIFLFSTGK